MKTVPDFKNEHKLWSSGIKYIAGVDEAGRGPLAGPVVAAAVVFSPDTLIEGLRDSKKLSPKKREELFKTINEKALSIGVGLVNPDQIDKLNILRATHLAMRQAIGRLKPQPQHILVDGRGLPDKIYPQTALIGGDNLSISIAAASIIAKVTRDRLMIKFDRVFPQYAFAKHKGYGTKQHREAIARFGPSPIHRTSFSGVKEHLIPYRTIKNKRTLGRMGEDEAAFYLFRKGYSILERNYHAGAYGEIDIIAESNEHIIFVEVKSSTSATSLQPEYRVDEAKIQQLGKIAEAYASKYPQNNKDYRFDVISVKLNAEFPVIRHIKDAFRL